MNIEYARCNKCRYEAETWCFTQTTVDEVSAHSCPVCGEVVAEYFIPQEGDLRVWWVENPPRHTEFHHVESIDEAIQVLKQWASVDLADDTIVVNAGGLEMFADGGWNEYYDDDSRDVREIMNEG